MIGWRYKFIYNKIEKNIFSYYFIYKYMNIYMEEYFINNEMFKFLVWTATCTIGYLLANLYIKPIKLGNKCGSCISRCIVLHNDTFDMDHQKKTDFGWYKNISYSILYSILLYFISDLNNRIQFNLWYLIYPIIIYGSGFIFGVISQISKLESSISISTLKDLSCLQKTVYILVGLILLAVYSFQIYLSYVDESIFYYLLFQVLTIVYYVGMWFGYVKHASNTTIHLHHWIISFGACLLFRYDHIITNIMFCIMYGIFLQGSICYGLADIFKNSTGYSENQQILSDINSIKKKPNADIEFKSYVNNLT